MKSELLTLVVGIALVTTLFVGPVSAVESSTQNLPEEAEVGSDVEATVELTDLFSEFEQWTLSGTTELESVTWTVRQFDQAGNQVSQTSMDGQSLSADVAIDDGVERIEVRVTGTAPAVENYTYEPPQRFDFANLTQARSGGSEQPIETYEVHHYTEESNTARNAIDDASEAVGSSDNGAALLDSAISSYENGNFENAQESARSAESEASRSRLIRNVLLGVGAIVLLGVLAFGGYRLYESQQQGPDRLK